MQTIEKTDDIAQQQQERQAQNERALFAHERELLFASRRTDLRLTKIQRYPKYGPLNQKMGELPGEAIRFVDGKLWVPAAEGKIKLEDGKLVDAAEIREFLHNHPLNGDRFEGFWQVELSAPAPSREELEALMRAATDPDLEQGLIRLREIINAEQNGWARDDILVVASEALERLQSIKATLEQGGAQ